MMCRWRLIRGICDEVARAIETGRPYQTRLDPLTGPPADEHGNFLPLPQWKRAQPRPAKCPPRIDAAREVFDWRWLYEPRYVPTWVSQATER